ncbi:hypothetical protein, variant [Cryptococcus amylolentus CBS 6039]|uniref:Uncharacterized protein n=2 Tax=Cryptococcus amylolentus TaxID=104669 RepID=A0A1E3HMX6_9TREE|nr:hypothetical protein L202_05614 [Cryptococcus amylolentus CBS 6039]XP_018992451.1 hypothetical protein, variant [Cryptococcus amylolentus CBS 6039]ODN77076.1 hypothetical protein L202_05614 [Cryptococcus amylolentus CBS 6039]ODN77077.1 hypothetical protein, variant [Cryptococcus amylolentus CBS 6039]ODO04931.1 hypothetical protein I350_05542 [Cryptococcus amylolentus CBS 6273]
MLGDRDPKNQLIVANPLEEAKIAGFDSAGYGLPKEDQERRQLARNCMTKFSTQLVYRRIPVEYIVETVVITRNSLPWDDIPRGWFRGAADPSSQPHYNWLHQLSFSPFMYLQYGTTQSNIMLEKNKIESVLEKEAY